jgi:hypothetical protein
VNYAFLPNTVADKHSLMYYVCEYADDRPLRFLAGPYDTDHEAVVAAAAFEVDNPEYRMKTRVWSCRGWEDVSRRIDSVVSTRGESASPSPGPSLAQHPPAPSQIALLSSYSPGSVR